MGSGLHTLLSCWIRMKQILQNLKTGATEIVEVPVPAAGRGRLLIRSSRTLVSAGTERMLVDFGKVGWIEKVRQQSFKKTLVRRGVTGEKIHVVRNGVDLETQAAAMLELLKI